MIDLARLLTGGALTVRDANSGAVIGSATVEEVRFHTTEHHRSCGDKGEGKCPRPHENSTRR